MLWAYCGLDWMGWWGWGRLRWDSGVHAERVATIIFDLCFLFPFFCPLEIISASLCVSNLVVLLYPSYFA